MASYLLLTTNEEPAMTINTAAIKTLTIGASTWIAGLKVTRISLLTYACQGYALDLEELEAELPAIIAERDAIQMEPGLRRAAEFAEGNLLGRGIRGRFSVRRDGVATWHADGGNWRSSERDALDTLEAVAGQVFGVRVTRIGYEVIQARRAA